MVDDIIKHCKMHGALTMDKVIKAGKHRSGNQQYKCHECHKVMRKNNWLKNRETILAKHRAYRLENPEARRQTIRKHYANHREEINAYERQLRAKWKAENRTAFIDRGSKYKRKACEELKDYWVKKTLTRNCNLTAKDIPQELVEIKRILMQLNRTLKLKRGKQKDGQKTY